MPCCLHFAFVSGVSQSNSTMLTLFLRTEARSLQVGAAKWGVSVHHLKSPPRLTKMLAMPAPRRKELDKDRTALAVGAEKALELGRPDALHFTVRVGREALLNDVVLLDLENRFFWQACSCGRRSYGILRSVRSIGSPLA